MATGADDAVGILLNVDLDAVDTLKQIVTLKDQVKALKTQQSELTGSTEQEKEQYEKLTVQIKAVNSQISTHQKTLTSTIKKQNATTNSVSAMRLKVAELKKEWANLDMDKDAEKFAATTKELSEMTEKLKEAEASVGVYSRNVGNYGDAMTGLLPIGGQYVQVLKSVQTASVAAGGGVKGLTALIWGSVKAAAAFIATPIGLTIAAIGLAVKGATSYFSKMNEIVEQSEELTNKYNSASIEAQAAEIERTKTLQRQAEGFVENKAATENWWASFKKVFSQAEALRTGGAEALDAEVESQEAYTKRVEETAAALKELIPREQAYVEERRKFVKQEADIETKIAELREKSKNVQDYTNEERKAFIVEAKNLNEQLGTQEAALAKEEYEIYSKRISLTKSTTEELNKEAELYANMVNVGKKVADSNRSIQRTITETTNAIAAETKAQQDLIKAREAEAKALAKQQTAYSQQLRDAITGMLTQTIDEQIDAVEKKYTEAIESMKKIDAPDPLAFTDQAEYDKAMDEYEEFTANQVAYAIRLEEQKAKEIEEINKSSLAQQAKDLEAAVNGKYAEDLLAYKNNEAKKIQVQQLALEEIIAKKKAAGLETYNEEARLEALRIKMIENSLARELASAELTAKERYDAKLAAYNAELALAEGNADLTIAINEKIAKADADLMKERIASASKYFSAASSMASELSNLFSAQSEAAIEEVDTQYEEEQEALDAKYEAGLISEEEYDAQSLALEEEYDAEIAELERQQAIRERALAIFQVGISTAQGIMSAVATSWATGGLPWSAYVAAMGAVQVAAILAEPLPTAATGGLIVGNSHANGGVILEAEGGEVIINKKSAEMFPSLLSDINEAGGGVSFASSSVSDGGYALRRSSGSTTSNDEIVNAIKEIQVFASIEEINKKQDRVKIVESRGTL